LITNPEKERAVQEFNDKVAVITGAASGIGRALADRCAREGMKVVLADVEAPALATAERELESSGARVLAVRTDVSRLEDVRKLADETLAAFGAVHLLFNNAGVGAGRQMVWNSSMADWQWVLGVNLWGVVHGAHVFIPIMLGQDVECHIVNTASLSGLVNVPGLGVYSATKHAVLSLSETLYHELALTNARVKVSVLCPGWVKTRIAESARNRPADLPAAPAVEQNEAIADFLQRRRAAELDRPPSAIADEVFAAIREERFYILTHDENKLQIETRMQDILNGRNPTLPPA
jgi:NAD(P)-dependent dehydrogenase (short-subunit alcohol dehydrogenase family)